MKAVIDMWRNTIVVLLLAVSCQASAGTIYKCTSGGRVTFSGTPCKHGSMKQFEVRSGRSDARDAQRHRRQAAVAATTRKNRLAMEQAELAKASAGNVAAAGRARRCAAMELAQKLADRKVDEAMSEDREKMRTKAAQHRQKMQIACRA